MENKQPETYKGFYLYFNKICESVDHCEDCPIQKAFVGINNVNDCCRKLNFEEVKEGHISIDFLKLLYDQIEEKRLNED